MDELAQRAIDFIAEHRDWAFWLAVALGAAETTAFLSLLIPSTVILVGIGALVATGALDFMPIWMGAFVGALIGSTFSYWLGWKFGDILLSAWPLSKDPELVAKGRAAFAKRGPAAVGIGHFLTFLRPVVFLLAGASGMKFLTFIAWNAAGGILWAFLLPKSGEVGGDVIGWLWQAITGG
jgi:membrane protein DedA with SNARE-associated domain